MFAVSILTVFILNNIANNFKAVFTYNCTVGITYLKQIEAQRNHATHYHTTQRYFQCWYKVPCQSLKKLLWIIFLRILREYYHRRYKLYSLPMNINRTYYFFGQKFIFWHNSLSKVDIYCVIDTITVWKFLLQL